MSRLRLGPLLRYVDERTATVWVETDGPCEARVLCDGGAGGTARTWRIAGHHYALITVTGLESGTETPYRVQLDGDQVWPLPGSPFPPSVIRTPAPGTTNVDVTFGSCRWAARPTTSHHDPVGPDAVDALAQRALSGGGLPDVLLLLGDQVYADETSEAVRAQLAGRRDLSEAPWGQVADFDEYTLLYDESWTDPEVRWLLSTVPSCMIFDDHDVIDDWNTSGAWRDEMRATDWWHKRIVSGLASFWVYQHLGNLSPQELAADPVFAAVRKAEDGTEALQQFAERADAEPDSTRWSFRRDYGRVRMVVVDTRAARVLEEDQRALLGKQELAWLREQMLAGTEGDAAGTAGAAGAGAMAPGSPGISGPPGTGAAGSAGSPDAPDAPGAPGAPGSSDGSYDHLLLGTSLPWLLPPAIHDAEVWNTALCGGVRGERWRSFGERVRRAADLEHWAAFPESFRALGELIEETATAPAAPSTVCVLSGDVHHAYISEPRFARPVRSRVMQLTCSPLHNSVPGFMRWGFRFGWSPAGRTLGRALARHARTRSLGRGGGPVVKWKRSGGPWFGNQLMTLVLRGRAADLTLEQARPVPGETGADGRVKSRLKRVMRRTLVSAEQTADGATSAAN